MLTFRKGGVHPPENKITASGKIVAVELPMEVTVAMSQHIGAPAVCTVKKGDHVERGGMVGKAAGFVSANVFSPISGTVIKVGKSKNAFGMPVDTVTIAASDEDHTFDKGARFGQSRTRDDVDALSPEEIVNIIGEAGIAGLGGATFPTRVKLTLPHRKHADLLIINGTECEPYLTNDHALMLAHPDELIEGVRLLMRGVNVAKAVIGIESNKRDAIALLRNRLEDCGSSIKVEALKVKYPQGGEKQLIKALTGREVPSGGLPVDVGTIVQNVATAYAVYEAVYMDKPLIDRVVTVTGPSVSNPGNYLVPIGMRISELVDLAGGVPADTGKIILGGPMMGRTAVSIDCPTTKGTSAVLMLPESQSRRGAVQPCIRCAGCVTACPMGLEPYRLGLLSAQSRWDMVEAEGVMNCIECGCCSYSCPSSRPLLDYIRLGKSTVGSLIRARSAKK